MARKASGMPPVRWGESSRPSTRAGGVVGGHRLARPHVDRGAQAPGGGELDERVEVDHGGAAHDEQRGAGRQELELAPAEHRLVVGRGRGEDEDHARGAQQLVEAGGLGARGADGQLGQPRVVGAHAAAEGREQAHELAAEVAQPDDADVAAGQQERRRGWPRARRPRCRRAWRGRPRVMPRARSMAMPSAASATAGAKAGLATSTWIPRAKHAS